MAAADPDPPPPVRRSATLTIGQLAQVLITELSPADLPVLSIASDRFFDAPPVRRRMALAVVAPSRRQSPVAFGTKRGSLVLQTVLVVLNGVATKAFDAEVGGAAALDTEGRHWPLGWWQRRRLALRLGRQRADAGADTRLPTYPPQRAAEIARRVRRIALGAGLSTGDSDRLAARIAGALGIT